jgi:hypothetical protein
LFGERLDAKRADEIEAEREELAEAGREVRQEVLAIPTGSPRGLLIKLAIAIEATSLEDIDERFARPVWYSTFDSHIAEDLLPVLAADLRAIVGASA